MVCFIVPRRPKSFNSWRLSTGRSYLQALVDSFGAIYPTHEVFQGDLYGTVYYFYKRNRDHDADNISKPVWDCLNSVVYADDKQIRLRIAGVFDLSRDDVQQLDLTRIPDPIFNQFLEAVDTLDDFLYIECGPLQMQHYQLNFQVK